MKRFPPLVLPAVMLCFAFSARADQPDRIGWVEMARIHPGNMLFATKMDTGAKSSSINAHDIEYFERDGGQWVRFQVVNRKKKMVTLELPVARDVVIKRHKGRTEERPVVMLGVCVHNTYAETPVSLVDRTGFLYPLLVGRTYLAGRFAVDPARKFSRDPECEETSRP